MFKKDKYNRKKYLSWLEIQLNVLNNVGSATLLTSQNFEKLENCELYSIRNTKIPGNPRVLYTEIDVEGNPAIVFLLAAFQEKNGISDYRHNIKVAQNREKEIKRELER